MKRHFFILFIAAALAMLAGCDSAYVPPEEDDLRDAPSSASQAALPVALQHELVRVRRATARYHDIEQARADGYVDIDVVVSGQGYHYLKPDLLDDSFDLTRPELLLYATHGGGFRLVGVEYAVPVDLAPTPPEGFAGEHDTWHLNADFGLWTLHAWVWLHNPNGVFAESNPRVP